MTQRRAGINTSREEARGLQKRGKKKGTIINPQIPTARKKIKIIKPFLIKYSKLSLRWTFFLFLFFHNPSSFFLSYVIISAHCCMHTTTIRYRTAITNILCVLSPGSFFSLCSNPSFLCLPFFRDDESENISRMERRARCTTGDVYRSKIIVYRVHSVRIRDKLDRFLTLPKSRHVSGLIFLSY